MLINSMKLHIATLRQVIPLPHNTPLLAPVSSTDYALMQIRIINNKTLSLDKALELKSSSTWQIARFEEGGLKRKFEAAHCP